MLSVFCSIIALMVSKNEDSGACILMVRTYNKLVRDKIPEIIEFSGKICTIEILSDEDYLCALDEKLDEELADLLEVIRATAIARGYTIEKLESICAQKAKEYGGFEKKIFLKEVQG